MIGDQTLMHDERGIKARPAPPHEPQDMLGPGPAAHRLRLTVERQRTAHLPARHRLVGAIKRGSEALSSSSSHSSASTLRIHGLRLIERELLLQRIAKPWLVNEPDRKAATNKILDDRRRPVRQPGIDDDNLGAVAKAFQAFADAGGLVEADHRGAQASALGRRLGMRSGDSVAGSVGAISPSVRRRASIIGRAREAKDSRRYLGQLSRLASSGDVARRRHSFLRAQAPVTISPQ